MSGVITAAAVVASVASTGYAMYQGQQQAQAQKKAMKTQSAMQDQAAGQARNQEAKSEMAMNAANQKQPDISAIQKAAQAVGGSSTMLTGSQGIDPGSLALGKPTLLGQ
jgi:uncharacterized protein HemX